MKQLVLTFAFVLTIYFAWVDPVSCVSCTVNGECNSTTNCNGDNSYPICQHPDGAEIVAGGGLCTCSVSTPSGSCTYASDCYDIAGLNCDNDTRHCFDNNCICSRFPIG
ncbi:uncharacterized protein LOC128549506 [Mercenaria mercenaria]|uniref:uncharacterized protein LOC128549506 n=1 Tax=Mercenaria mercenaria TaxID=6596 RepID=UPI00234F7F4F|nr:uncharacterized protein LOC128549506 [Mercenaria mercenaria]